VIVAVDDRDVASPGELSRALSRKEGEVSLTVVRDKQKQTIRVTLERRERSDRRVFTFDGNTISEGVFDFDWDFDFNFDYDFDLPDRLYWFDSDAQRRAIENLLQRQQRTLDRYNQEQQRYRNDLQKYQQEMLKRRLVDQLRRNQQRAVAQRYAAQARTARLETLKRNQLRELYRKSTPTPTYRRLVSTTIL
jgi:hypothetical protein